MNEIIFDLSFGFKHLEDFITEQFFKFTGTRRGTDHKSAIAIKTPIGCDDMQMRIEISCMRMAIKIHARSLHI